MPRETPVTRATLPSSRNMGPAYNPGRHLASTRGAVEERGYLAERSGVADAEHLDVLRDALDEAREHLARSDLESVSDAAFDHETNAGLPAHRPVDLAHEQVLHACRVFVRLPVEVGDDGEAGALHLDARELGLEDPRGGGHE